MRHISRLIILSLFFLPIFIVSCNKDDRPEPPSALKVGAIQGKVSNEYNQLLIGAVVTLTGNGVNNSKQSTTGNFRFDSLSPGPYSLSVKKDGYIETSAAITVITADTVSKDFILKAGEAYFNLLSDTLIIAKPYASTYSIKIESNTSWAIDNANDWITPGKLSGNGNDSLVVGISAWTGDTARQSSFALHAGSITRNIRVKQLANVNLKQSSALPGNSVQGITDSIILHFNQPVNIVSIFPGVTYCQSAINFTYAGNRVSFSYACGALGGDYPFTITTTNSEGDQYAFTFTVGFYEKAINLTGTIQSSFVNDADNSFWVITDHPNALYKIDMSSFEILHRYDLPYEPVMFTISPYNNKIYLAYAGIPRLFIMDQSGTVEKVIDIIPDSTRNQYERDGPRINPVKLAFAKNGMGMIWLSDSHPYSYTGFWFIDATANHRIWYQPLPGEEVNYADVKVNYDQTKFVLKYMNDDPTIGIFDSEQFRFSSYKPTKTTRGVFLSPSRKNENIYSGQLYNQLIVNPGTGFESQESFKDNRSFGSVDFCYKPGREQTIYFVEEGHIEVMDYATRMSPVNYDALAYLTGTTATLDGKHLIVTRHDGNYNAKVIQLPASWFDY